MSWSFSAHFQALEPGHGEGPDAELVRADLRRALEAELRRRGLWSASPAYVGVLGHRRWDAEALDELAGECYLYQLARLRSLRAQLAAGANLDGFVRLNIRHFLFERQRAHDPLGYRVFEMLERAIARAVEEGRLALLDGAERVRNDTVVAFPPAARAAALAAGEDLAPLARRWSDDLLPALVTAQGRPQREAVVSRLLDHLVALPNDGIRAFRFGDLAEPLKADVRARWAALGEQERGGTAFEAPASEDEAELARLVRTVLPDAAVEDRDHFDKLLACAAGRLARLSPGDGAGELLSLLSSLARHARDPSADERPSHRALAREAGVPRHRLPALLVRLRQVIADCEHAIGAARTVNDRGWRSSARGGT